MYPDLSLDKSVHTPYLSATPQVRPTFRLAWEVINDRLRIGSIGISPLPGTPPAAHFCYGSIIVPRACHRRPSSATWIQSYKFDRSRHTEVIAHLRHRLICSSQIGTGNVLMKWVFNCQRSARSLFVPSSGRQRECPFFKVVPKNFSNIFLWSPFSV